MKHDCVCPGMDVKSFESRIELQTGVSLDNVQAALDYLSHKWPGERGPRHRDAMETCLKVLAGERSTADARDAVCAAAAEAELLAGDK